MRFVTITLLILAATTRPALCQKGQAPVSRADVAASLGSFNANHGDVAEYNAWTNSLFGALSGGVYWTDHLKSEVEVAWTGQSETYGIETSPLPAAPFAPLFVEHYYSSFKFSAAQVYQFGRNARAHPFVSAGIDVDRERHTSERPPQFPIPSGNPLARGISLPGSSRTETNVRAQPFAAMGLKAYFSERVFFRTDLKVNFTGRAEQVLLKAGVGIDF